MTLANFPGIIFPAIELCDPEGEGTNPIETFCAFITNAAGVAYILPVTGAIVSLLAILYFSYRQTIAAYPGGGGSYTVARESLGDGAGLLTASALMIDYVLRAGCI